MPHGKLEMIKIYPALAYNMHKSQYIISLTCLFSFISTTQTSWIQYLRENSCSCSYISSLPLLDAQGAGVEQPTEYTTIIKSV